MIIIYLMATRCPECGGKLDKHGCCPRCGVCVLPDEERKRSKRRERRGRERMGESRGRALCSLW